MTQYPEVALARELEMCYVNIALITDFDAGLDGQPGIEPVTVGEVVRVLHDNNERVRRLIERLVPRLAGPRTCPCATALALATADPALNQGTRNNLLAIRLPNSSPGRWDQPSPARHTKKHPRPVLYQIY